MKVEKVIVGILLTTLSIFILDTALVCNRADAAEPVVQNYIAYQSVANPGTDADNQAVAVLSTPTLDVTEWITDFIPFADKLPWFDYKALYVMHSTGFTDVDSSPVFTDHGPEVYAERDITKEWSVDFGAQHRSNGESDDESRSVNQFFARSNQEKMFGDIVATYSIRLFYIVGEPEGEIRDLRAFGDNGRWGLDGELILTHSKYGSLHASVKENYAVVRLTADLMQSSPLQPMIYAKSAKMDQLEQDDTVTRALGVGATYSW